MPAALEKNVTVGVLALQGAFNEHIQLLRSAAVVLSPGSSNAWTFIEVRTPEELDSCDALIIPGGESTAISLIAERCGILEPLRDFVKKLRKPTWGTCAGLILLAESANRTKKGGQELIGGLDVRVNRNHFGRQIESFAADLDIPFLYPTDKPLPSPQPFKAIFIRAPIVEKLLPSIIGTQADEAQKDETVIAPARDLAEGLDKKLRVAPVEILITLPGRSDKLANVGLEEKLDKEAGDIIAVRQANVFGTSFHPELTGDPRIHAWWLGEVLKSLSIP